MLITLVKHMNLNEGGKKILRRKTPDRERNSFSILKLCAIRWLERHSFLHNVIAYQHVGLGQVTENGD